MLKSSILRSFFALLKYVLKYVRTIILMTSVKSNRFDTWYIYRLMHNRIGSITLKCLIKEAFRTNVLLLTLYFVWFTFMHLLHLCLKHNIGKVIELIKITLHQISYI